MEATRQPTLYDSWRALVHFVTYFRRRLLWAFFIPFTLFFLYSFTPTPRYKSESILMVRLGNEYVFQPESMHAATAPNQFIPFDRDQIFKSEVAILNSSDVHREVIRAMGVETLFPQLFNLSWFRIGLIKMHHGLRDALIFIGLVHGDALTSDERLMARAVELFDKNFSIALEKESAIITIDFEHPNPAIANKTLETLLTQYFQKRRSLYIESRVKLAQEQRAEKRATMEQAEAAVAEYKRANGIYAFDEQRAALLAQRNQLQAQAMVINHPGIAAKLGDYNKQLTNLDAHERQLKQLEHEASIAEESYAMMTQNLDEAEAYEDRQQQHANSVRVIQQPETPPYPKKWQKIIILAGIMVGGLSVLATAAFSEFSRYAPRNRRASDRRNPNDTGQRRRLSDPV